jgi:hypothetical protein
MLLSGYGSYGVSNDPSFSREDIPLMDRGRAVHILAMSFDATLVKKRALKCVV